MELNVEEYRKQNYQRMELTDIKLRLEMKMEDLGKQAAEISRNYQNIIIQLERLDNEIRRQD